MIHNLLKRIETLQAWKKYILLFLLGSSTVFAFAPFYIFPLLFLSFPVLIYLIAKNTSWKSAFLMGWFFGFGKFVTGTHWISNSLKVDYEQFGWLIPFSLTVIPSYCAFYIAFATLCMHLFTKDPSKRILLFPVTWSLFEWVRGHALIDFPWNLIGYTLYVQLETVQAASLIGVYGLSFLTALILALPVLYFIKNKKKLYFVSSLIVFACLWGFGTYRLHQPTPQEDKGPLVRLVQGNIPQKLKWNRSFASRSLYAYFSLSFPENEEKKPNLFIWPEAALPFYINEHEFIRHEISKRMPKGSYLVIGTLRKTIHDAPIKLYNSLVILDDRGCVLSIYDKTHLVPFGEYIPLKKWLPFKKITHGLLDISAGKKLKTLSIKGLPSFSPLICYEGIFPGNVKDPHNRPDWLINITNDAWFGDSNGPHQHLDIIRLRSIEEGLPIGRVAGTGITALIDSYGRILNKIALHKSGVIDSPVPAKLPPTLYARYGDLIFFTLLLFWGIFCYIFCKRFKF